MVAPVLDGHIRQIRDIQLSCLDLEPLLPNRQEKLPSTTINTYGALLQQTLDNASKGSDDPAIFSSWLGAITLGVVKDKGNEGSFDGHVLAAVSTQFSSERN